MATYAGKRFSTFKVRLRRLSAGKRTGRARVTASSIGLTGAKRLTAGNRVNFR